MLFSTLTPYVLYTNTNTSEMLSNNVIRHNEKAILEKKTPNNQANSSLQIYRE